MESLTKENFWNDIYARYPQQVQKFCDWIDEYKKRVNWDNLFFNEDPEFYDHAAKGRKIKYHDLPLAMQLGIFIQFVSENPVEDSHYYLKIEDGKEFIIDYFKEANDLSTV